MEISSRFLDQLRNAVPLSEVVGQRVRLSRAGREFKGCCPFHHEKTPSFTVNDDKQFYHCFGCGAHGDVIGFVMSHDNLSFVEAVEMLAGRAGLSMPRQSPEEVKKAKESKSLYALMDRACKLMQGELYKSENAVALSYLHERGVSDDLIAAFRIGYAPDNGQSLRQQLLEEGFTDSQMVESGVIRQGKGSNQPYAFFRQRIMFPVGDRRGRVIAFGGRILPDHLRPPDRGDFTPPKYINSPDTPLFSKSRSIYGESHARQAAGDGDVPVVVEGYMDVIALFHAGWRAAVAPLGTALTEEQILGLWGMMRGEVKAPVLCFDGDSAGQRAAERAAERILPLLKPGLSAQFVFMPEGEDPDTLARSAGAEGLGRVLNCAMPLIDFIWRAQTAGRRLDTPEEKAALATTLEDLASRVPDRTVQHYYRQAFRDKLFANFGWRGSRQRGSQIAGRSNRRGRADAGHAPVRVNAPVWGHMERGRRIMLAALINYPEIYPGMSDLFDQLDFQDPGLKRLHQTCIEALNDQTPLDSEGLYSHLNAGGYGDYAQVVLNEATYLHAGFARPGHDIETVSQGCRDIWQRMHQLQVGLEYKQAGKDLAENMDEQTFGRVAALYAYTTEEDGESS